MTIRRTPEDFFVDERLNPAWLAALSPRPSPTATHALLALEKTSLATPEAVQLLARELGRGGVRSADIAYAGLKDKHARTCQHVSLQTRDPTHAESLPKTISGRNWSAMLLGFSPVPVAADAIAHNHFRILVRDLSRQASDEMARRADLLAEQHDDNHALVFTNYFGDQRFGSARHGEGFVAAYLIKGEFEHALRLSIGIPARKDSGVRRTFTRALAARWGQWALLAQELPRCPERRAIEHLASHPGDFRGAFAALPMFTQQMCVEAFQSHLWNAAARLLALRIADEHSPLPSEPVMPTPERPRVKLKKPDTVLLRTPDPFIEMLFPVAKIVDDGWRAVDMPLLAPSAVLTAPWADAAASVLSDHALTVDELKIPGLRRPYFGVAPRRLFVRAEVFSMSAPEHDELTPGKRLKRTLTFNLPRGSYATVLLRALGQ